MNSGRGSRLENWFTNKLKRSECISIKQLSERSKPALDILKKDLEESLAVRRSHERQRRFNVYNAENENFEKDEEGDNFFMGENDESEAEFTDGEDEEESCAIYTEEIDKDDLEEPMENEVDADDNLDYASSNDWNFEQQLKGDADLNESLIIVRQDHSGVISQKELYTASGQMIFDDDDGDGDGNEIARGGADFSNKETSYDADANKDKDSSADNKLTSGSNSHIFVRKLDEISTKNSNASEIFAQLTPSAKNSALFDEAALLCSGQFFVDVSDFPVDIAEPKRSDFFSRIVEDPSQEYFSHQSQSTTNLTISPASDSCQSKGSQKLSQNDGRIVDKLGDDLFTMVDDDDDSRNGFGNFSGSNYCDNGPIQKQQLKKHDKDEEVIANEDEQQRQQKNLPLPKDLIDDEASLSGDDVGSDGDDLDDVSGNNGALDEYEPEEGDLDKGLDEEEIREGLVRQYLKHQRDRDDRRILKIQERLFVDGDLHGLGGVGGGSNDRSFRLRMRDSDDAKIDWAKIIGTMGDEDGGNDGDVDEFDYEFIGTEKAGGNKSDEGEENCQPTITLSNKENSSQLFNDEKITIAQIRERKIQMAKWQLQQLKQKNKRRFEDEDGNNLPINRNNDVCDKGDNNALLLSLLFRDEDDSSGTVSSLISRENEDNTNAEIFLQQNQHEKQLNKRPRNSQIAEIEACSSSLDYFEAEYCDDGEKKKDYRNGKCGERLSLSLTDSAPSSPSIACLSTDTSSHVVQPAPSTSLSSFSFFSLGMQALKKREQENLCTYDSLELSSYPAAANPPNNSGDDDGGLQFHRALTPVVFSSISNCGSCAPSTDNPSNLSIASNYLRKRDSMLDRHAGGSLKLVLKEKHYGNKNINLNHRVGGGVMRSEFEKGVSTQQRHVFFIPMERPTGTARKNRNSIVLPSKNGP